VSHFIVRCPNCKEIIRQCRCPGPKTETFEKCGTCPSCEELAIIEPGGSIADQMRALRAENAALAERVKELEGLLAEKSNMWERVAMLETTLVDATVVDRVSMQGRMERAEARVATLEAALREIEKRECDRLHARIAAAALKGEK
jgi:hypothetical protein